MHIANSETMLRFRWTAEGLSHTYTRIHSPPDSPPIPPIQAEGDIFSSWIVQPWSHCPGLIPPEKGFRLQKQRARLSKLDRAKGKQGGSMVAA